MSTVYGNNHIHLQIYVIVEIFLKYNQPGFKFKNID